ncbi:MAG: RNHCP domain-containing protein [Alphaproteobacteria bacterium]|nr:RNHCP domain-containing protein [Alphaproteobacteria bacterium]
MKKFSRRIENFICANCGTDVYGNGYTNHCPKCLWSKCVDINPGDRANHCNGMMKPAAIEASGNKFIIIHKCEKCGKIARCKSAYDDNIDNIILLSQNSDFIFGK